jgi:PAS domain S-box-containing protein
VTFERLLADLSARFANTSGDQLETEIESALKRLLEFLGFDRSNFGEFAADGQVTILCSVAKDGVERYPPGPAPAFLSWYNGQLRAGKIIHVRSLDDLPPEAIGETEYYRRSGIRSSIGIPLRVGGSIVGLINFAAFRSTRKWPDDLIARLKVVGEVMAVALARKRSEAALQASEERWRSMVENPLFGITFLDQHGRFITTNPTYQRMTGYTNEELRGLTPLDISVAGERELNEFLLKELQEGKRQHYEIVKQLVRKDGGLIWIQLYVFAIPDPKTKTLLIFGVTFDITESKLAQDALQATRAELAHVSRMNHLGALTASITHEINQPLAAIVSNANAAIRWLANATPDYLDEARAAVKQIANDGHRAAEVVQGIRSLFKSDGQNRVPLDVNQLIREVLVLVQGDLLKHRISVDIELNENLPLVMADRAQLQQVVMNLVMNAMDAMEPITDRRNILRVKSAIRDGDAVVVTIEDSGTGIDPKKADRLFDAFFTTKPRGTGMGLSICRSIVEAHNGRVWASAGAHCGSAFSFELPTK